LRVAVLPFRNVAGDAQLDGVGDMLLFLLTTDLRQSTHISVVAEDTVQGVLERMDLSESKAFSRENLEDLAKETRATHFLKGSYVKLGDTFRVVADLQDARTLESLASEREDGIGDKALGSITDSLTKRLKPHLNLSAEEIAGDQDMDIAQVTTPVPRALELFLEARKAMNKRDLHKAADFLDNAIVLDPDFAMAYRLLAGCYNRMALEEDSLRKDYWNKAGEYTQASS
jgi:TolB-like protein